MNEFINLNFCYKFKNIGFLFCEKWDYYFMKFKEVVMYGTFENIVGEPVFLGESR